MKIYPGIACFLLLVCCSCQLQTVNVDTYFVGPESLASYWVGTPDPKRSCPDVGQELILSWNMPKGYVEYKNLYIRWTIRFGNHQEDVFDIHVRSKRGERNYFLINQDYWDRCGVQTYKVEVIADGMIIHSLCNSVWTNLVEVGQEYKEEEAM